jgi:hypothetical protein
VPGTFFRKKVPDTFFGEKGPDPFFFLPRAFLPRRFGPVDAVLGPVARWEKARASAADRAAFERFTGQSLERGLPLLAPHVLFFKLQMAALTNPRIPVPIWRALQVRNRIAHHAPIAVDEPLDLEIAVAASRALEKGIEIDFHTTASVAGRLAWEVVTTVYYRGRFGLPPGGQPVPRPPRAPETEVGAWRADEHGGWAVARLTGDFNGVHYSDRYARHQGFARAFHHPQRMLGVCFAHLGLRSAAPPQRLEAWLRGPVFYGSALRLCAAEENGGKTFALYTDADPRPAILGVVGKA